MQWLKHPKIVFLTYVVVVPGQCGSPPCGDAGIQALPSWSLFVPCFRPVEKERGHGGSSATSESLGLEGALATSAPIPLAGNDQVTWPPLDAEKGEKCCPCLCSSNHIPAKGNMGFTDN